MDAKAVCVLLVLACAVLTSRAMSLPGRESQSTDVTDVLVDTVQALEKVLDNLKTTMDSEDGEGEGEESRRRRSITGVHRPYIPRYRGSPRPAIYRPIFRPGSRMGPRPNFSQY